MDNATKEVQLFKAKTLEVGAREDQVSVIVAVFLYYLHEFHRRSGGISNCCRNGRGGRHHCRLLSSSLSGIIAGASVVAHLTEIVSESGVFGGDGGCGGYGGRAEDSGSPLESILRVPLRNTAAFNNQ
nr:hypothetical protein Iba_chr08aCG3560 [Ipomoea batatas]